MLIQVWGFWLFHWNLNKYIKVSNGTQIDNTGVSKCVKAPETFCGIKLRIVVIQNIMEEQN